MMSGEEKNKQIEKAMRYQRQLQRSRDCQELIEKGIRRREREIAIYWALAVVLLIIHVLPFVEPESTISAIIISWIIILIVLGFNSLKELIFLTEEDHASRYRK
jgi:predicted nucleic acid-binding Zn ribbon protein